MDPNATLAEILATLEDFNSASDNVTRAVIGCLLAARIQDLHEWLSGGGFLPAAWASSAGKLAPADTLKVGAVMSWDDVVTRLGLED